MYESPTMFAQNRCSAWEIISRPLFCRGNIGGPPAAAKHRSSSSVKRAPVIDRSTMFSGDARARSSTIEAILTAVPSMVESNWTSNAHSAFRGQHSPAIGYWSTPRRICATVTSGFGVFSV